MRSRFTWILTLFFALIMQVGFAQSGKQVTGVVKTEDGDPIPGATVMVVGTTFGTDTDDEGKYTLSLKKGDKVRVVYEGFKAVTLTVGDSSVLNATLVEDESVLLGDVVIDMYRTVSKEKSAVAATTVTSKTIEGRPNASFLQTLQGQIPGLNIATGSGQPGSSDTQVLLRGLGSINGNVQPLYIIDGVPMSSDRFRSINPNDIENISVLKDAGATAIYGNRGANGVIVVTTKNASFDSALSVKYVGTVGVSSLQENQYNLMNTNEYDSFLKRAKAAYPSANPPIPSLTAAQRKVDTDWTDVFMRDALMSTHTLSFSAGSKNLSSYTSVGYSDYEGILKDTGLQRFNFRSNLNGKSSDDRLVFGTNVSANFSKNDQATSVGTNGINQNYFLGAFQAAPWVDPNLYTNGRELYNNYANGTFGDWLTPLMLMDKMRSDQQVQNEFKLLVNGNISYKLTDNLTLGNNSGVDYQTIHQNGTSKYDSFNQILFYGSREWQGSVNNINESRMVFSSNTSLKYDNTWNDVHTLGAGVYVEYIKGHLTSSSINKLGFDPIFWSEDGSTGWIQPTASTALLYAPTASMLKQNAGMFSYFGNANYDYDRRYGVDVTIRRDASFRFTDENRWGTFWSVSGRWNINNEKFMENSVFNNLKLRGSYGTTGNQDILNTGFFGAEQRYQTLYRSGAQYNGQQGLYISNLPNPNLQWEIVKQGNIGLDFGVWNDRLRGSLDVYNKRTDDLYLTQFVSAINGATSIPANYGSLENKGVEIGIAGDVIRKDNTRLTLNVTGAYNKNKVLEIPSETGYYWNPDLSYGYQVGGVVNEFYLFEFAGINPNTGMMEFYTKDGGVTEQPTDADRRWLGKSSVPVYQGGFGLDFEHNGWFLTANFTYAQDVWRFDNDYWFYTNPSVLGNGNISNDYADFWTPTNRDARFPRLDGSNYDRSFDSDFYIQDASYVRLRFLSVGYNFKKKDLDFLKLSGLRVYAQGENLYTWTKWRGWDAESNRTFDYGQYPTPKTVSFGVEVSF